LFVENAAKGTCGEEIRKRAAKMNLERKAIGQRRKQ
jgi:hypothetical protein